MKRTLAYYRDLLREEGLLEQEEIAAGAGREIEGLTFDSREAVQNGLFICKGAAFRPEYLADARRNGCVCYVAERRCDAGEDCDYLIVTDIRRAMAVLAAAFYGHPEKELHLTGITGTKGKTTTAYYLKGILDAWARRQGRKPTGLLSSIESIDGRGSRRSLMTTPEAPEVYRHLRSAADAELSYFTMEVSSQALKYGRVRGLTYDAGIFLNISEDHISPREHVDFEDYFSAKLSLFKQTRTACVCVDSPFADRILKAARMAEHVVTFGTVGEADICGHDIRLENGRLCFGVRCDRFDEEFSLSMHGGFNVENALAAIAAAYVYGIPADCMRDGLKNVHVSGRMEQYASADGKVVAVVDYAHNRLSFERLFDAIHAEYPGWRVVSVFGCPGDKALNRRRDLGLIAGLFSHKVYLTADDPGMERVGEINREIARYVEMVGCVWECMEDRGEAIRRAVTECTERTVVLVLGKGNEGHQRIGSTVYPYPPDAQLVREALKEYEDYGCEAVVGK